MKAAVLKLAFLLGGFSIAASAESRHELVESWPQLPAGLALGPCSGIGVDSKNRIFVFHRNDRKWTSPFPNAPIAKATVSVFDGPTGRLLFSWGGNRFIMPHGLTVDHEGHVWLTDAGLHQVFKCTAEGKVLMTLGEAGVPGADPSHFNLPTDVAVLRDGSFYVSDGYKNSRVVKFAADGCFEFQWGTKGKGPGEFHLPHGIAVDAPGRVIVCDRENERLQVFDARGAFITAWSGPRIGKPYGITASPDGSLFIIDGGQPSLRPEERGKAVKLDSDGKVMWSFGGPGLFQLGHDIAAAPDGSVYVAEVNGQRVRKLVPREK